MIGKNFYRIGGIFIFGIFSILSFTYSYAAMQENAKPLEKNPSVMCEAVFSPQNEDDFKIQLIYENEKNVVDESRIREEEVNQLEAFLTYDDKVLNISCVEAIPMLKIINQEAYIAINYRIKVSNSHNIIKEGTYELGTVPLLLSVGEPYWRIYQDSFSLGIGIPGIGVPQKIYELLPESITGLKAYNTVIKASKEGIIEGVITIKQGVADNSEIPPINLSSLELKEEINREMIMEGKTYSTLELMTNYDFCIPFTVEGEKEYLEGTTDVKSVKQIVFHSLKIQGKLTLKKYIKVYNDLDMDMDKLN